MKSEWKERLLGSLCSRLSSGKGISAAQLSLTAPIPVYGGNGIRGYVHDGNFSGECAIIGRQGAYCGNVRFFRGSAYMTEHAVVVQANEANDTRFLAYKLSLMDLGRLSGQSAQPGLSVKVLAQQSLRVPSRATQRKIAAVLSSLDDKIETNNAICQNLEELVDALFNKCIEEGNMQVPFLSLVEVQGGGTPKTGQSEYWSGEIPFFTPKDVSVPFTFETGKSLTCEGLAHCNSPLYPAWTTFVTARGTVGKLAMAGLPMAMNQSCYALVGKKIHPILAFMYSRSVVHSLKKKSTGSVFDAIVTRDFETENVKRLSDERKFIDVALPMYERIYILMQENNRLATLRDTLLPRLMSGELDVNAVKL